VKKESGFLAWLGMTKLQSPTCKYGMWGTRLGMLFDIRTRAGVEEENLTSGAEAPSLWNVVTRGLKARSS
jgi:hypothetical protein